MGFGGSLSVFCRQQVQHATTTWSPWPTAPGVVCGRNIAVPVLVVGNLADDACTPSHIRRLFRAIGYHDKETNKIPGATHYYAGPEQRHQLRAAVDIVTDRLIRHDFARPQ